MKKQKTLKRVFSAVVASALMTSAVSAQVVYEQNFENVTQYDLFGNVFKYTGNDQKVIDNLFPGETIVKNVQNDDGTITTTTTVESKDYGTGQLEINSNFDAYATTFFSIEDGKGVMTKIGTRSANNRYGFKKSLSEEIKKINETENDETEENVIKSGIWNFDFTLQSMNGGGRYFVLRNGDEEKLSININRYFDQIAIAPTIATESQKMLTNGMYTDDAAQFSYCTVQNDGVAKDMRIQIDFDNNKLNIYKNKGTLEAPDWGLITAIPTKVDGLEIVKADGKIKTNAETGTYIVKDENGTEQDSKEKKATEYDNSGVSLKDFDVDLKDGIDGFGYEEVFNANPNRTIIDNIKISKEIGGQSLFECDFEDSSTDENGNVKDSWLDYGFESTSMYDTAYMNDGKLNYNLQQYKEMTLDKKIDETANNGVWAVTVKYQAEKNDGTDSMPARYTGADPRSFINFLNDTNNSYEAAAEKRNAALAISCHGYQYPHMWRIVQLNGEKQSNVFVNSEVKRPGGQSMVSFPKDGAAFKFVFDFNKMKMYMYADVNHNQNYKAEWSIMNPDGYDLPEGFNFNKIRLYDCQVGDVAYAAWDYIKIEKFDNTDDFVFTVDGGQGNMVDKDTILNINIESYRAPSAESKTTFIDKSEVYTIAAVYDGNNKLVDLKPIPNVQYSVAEEFNTELQFDKIDNGNTIKIFAVDPTSLKPLSGKEIKTLEGVNMSDTQ